jgi:uncharacterized protein YbjT (DUF2867 family)
VSAAVKGHDAVLVVLGAGMSRKSRIRSDGTLNVIRAMQAHGPRRLIVQSTLGARDSWNTLNFWWKRVMFGALLSPVFRDHELQERLVEASGLDWTIVRPGAFTDAATKRPVIEDVPKHGPRPRSEDHPRRTSRGFSPGRSRTAPTCTAPSGSRAEREDRKHG